LSVAALFAALVFVADLLSPLGGAAWVLYLPVVLAPVWLNNPRQVVLASAACSVLVLTGFFLAHTDVGLWRGLRNRGMGLMALWLTASAGIVICRRSMQLAEALGSLRLEIAKHEQTETRRQELERQVVEIAAQEQRRIGQELHDGVGQELTGLGLMANALAQRLQERDPEQRMATRLVAGLDRVHQQVRTLSRGLVPVLLEAKGLCAALDDLATGTSEQSGIPITFDCPEWLEVPDHATATQLFRIAQEAVSNALSHGQARHVRVSLLAAPPGLRLSIRDDGAGMPYRPAEGNGMGLRIMQYRAEQIGGALQIGPAPGGGTVVTCLLPRRETHDDQESGNGAGRGDHSDRG
jgi:signal transduction histidine kinase